MFGCIFKIIYFITRLIVSQFIEYHNIVQYAIYNITKTNEGFSAHFQTAGVYYAVFGGKWRWYNGNALYHNIIPKYTSGSWSGHEYSWPLLSGRTWDAISQEPWLIIW